MKYWTREAEYLFDLNGYIIISNYFDDVTVNRLRQALVQLEGTEHLPKPLIFGKPRTKNSAYISNIAEAGPDFTSIIKDPCINEVMNAVMGGYYRFNHSYATSHGLGEQTTMHMGGSPIHPKATYLVKNNRIFSSLTKVIIPLENNAIEDGCFCVVPGSHKSNFEFGNTFNLKDPREHPSFMPVPAEPGDLIVFTEALQHGGLENTSGRTRRTIFYCYSLGNVIDWGGDLGLVCSKNLMNTEDQEIRDIVALKGRL